MQKSQPFARKTATTDTLSGKPSINQIDYIKGYTIPKLRENTNDWYIEYYAYNPGTGKLSRKRLRVNRIQSPSEKRAYARTMIKRLTQQLAEGWNPFLEQSDGRLYAFDEVMDKFESWVTKMFNDGNYREDTYISYKSFIKNVDQYNQQRISPIKYLYQMDKRWCNDALDYFYIERNNSAQTRNNYLGFIKAFANFAISKGWLETNPAETIQKINRKLIKKERTVIPKEVIKRISDYLTDKDKHFLFACYLLYYCYIRPKELTRIKISDFDLKNATIIVSDEESKNRRSETITLPKKILHFAIELEIFSKPSLWYVFSKGFKPGTTQITPKQFRDAWGKLKRPCALKPQYKFYSLKDTGITEMLDNKMPNLYVRDQARHSNLAITDIYTRKAGTKGNQDIIEYDGSL